MYILLPSDTISMKSADFSTHKINSFRSILYSNHAAWVLRSLVRVLYDFPSEMCPTLIVQTSILLFFSSVLQFPILKIIEADPGISFFLRRHPHFKDSPSSIFSPSAVNISLRNVPQQPSVFSSLLWCFDLARSYKTVIWLEVRRVLSMTKTIVWYGIHVYIYTHLCNISDIINPIDLMSSIYMI